MGFLTKTQVEAILGNWPRNHRLPGEPFYANVRYLKRPYSPLSRPMVGQRSPYENQDGYLGVITYAYSEDARQWMFHQIT